MSKSSYFDAVELSKCFCRGPKPVENYLKNVRIPSYDIIGNRLQNDRKYKELEMHCTFKYLLENMKKPNFNAKNYAKFISLMNPHEFVDLIIFNGIRSDFIIKILQTSKEGLTTYNFFIHLNYRVVNLYHGCIDSLNDLQKYVWDILLEKDKKYILNVISNKCRKHKKQVDVGELYTIILDKMYRNPESLICDCKDILKCKCEFGI